MNKNFSFDTIPEVLASIVQKLDNLEKKIVGLHLNDNKEDIIWMNVQELCKYLPNHPAEHTVYGWTSTRKIPFHKNGKNISFLKSEIDEWLNLGKRPSIMDSEKAALYFVNSKRKNLNHSRYVGQGLTRFHNESSSSLLKEGR